MFACYKRSPLNFATPNSVLEEVGQQLMQYYCKSVIDKYSDTSIVVYIDLTAAYDHIPRNFPFEVLDLRTGASHLIAILYKMYQGTTASIFGMKERFEELVGCRQRGQELPCIFNYFFDYVLKGAACEINKHRIRI